VPGPAPSPAPRRGVRALLAQNRALLLRAGALALALAVFWLVAARAGLLAALTLDRLRATVAALGPLGYAVYVAVFVVGELLYLPAFLFIGLAAALYGKALAFALAFGGGLASSLAGFGVGRLFGRGLDRVPPWLARLDAQLAARGIRTVAFLRLLFWLAPYLNMGLGFTRVRWRDYLAGTALGIFPIVLLLTTVLHDVIGAGVRPGAVTIALPGLGLLALFAWAVWRRKRLLAGGPGLAPRPPAG
jgi:phospholipase D1/2